MTYYEREYVTVTDARTALQNSGVYEWFEGIETDQVSEWMWRNHATPDEAAEHFDVA